MTSFRLAGLAGLTAAAMSIAAAALAQEPAPIAPGASPLFGVTIPDGYRQWPLVAPAEEGEPLNELRAVLANASAMQAYEKGVLPFPDGTVLVKLAWRREASREFEPAAVPGAPTTVQVMIKEFEAIRGYRWLGVRPLRERQAGRRGATSDLLCVPRGPREGA